MRKDITDGRDDFPFFAQELFPFETKRKKLLFLL